MGHLQIEGNSELPGPPDPPDDDLDDDNNEAVSGLYEDGGDGDDNGGDETESNPHKIRKYWPPQMYEFFDEVREAVDSSTKFKGRGSTARFEEMMPSEYQGIASPFVSPELFFRQN